jgi:hypothetical protein
MSCAKVICATKNVCRVIYEELLHIFFSGFFLLFKKINNLIKSLFYIGILMGTHFPVQYLILVNANKWRLCKMLNFFSLPHRFWVSLICMSIFHDKHLENNELSGGLPSSFGDLPNLKEL